MMNISQHQTKNNNNSRREDEEGSTSANEATDICSFSSEFTTTYNEDLAIPPLVGIMFEVFAKTDIQVTTLELDLRIDANTTDLFVEVFAKDGTYRNFIRDMNEWEIVARTSPILLNPDNSASGAIIPYESFKTVNITAPMTKAFYVTMRGPYIDFTADALMKTGEVQKTTPDMELSVGSGFSEPRFPESGINSTVDPQFAGVIHYKKEAPCNKLQELSTVEFQFLFNQKLLPPEIPPAVTSAVDAAILSLMQNDPELNDYVLNHGLQKLNQTNTETYDYNGGCPEGFEECPGLFVTTTVTLANLNTLDSGLVRYRIYRQVSDIVEATALGVAKAWKGARTAYIGNEAISVTYEVTLTGVPANVEINDAQKKYFGIVTTSFLDATAVDKFAHVFVTTVEQQNAAGRQLRSLQSTADLGSILLQGKIFGAQAAAMDAENFRLALEESFLLKEDEYVNNLKTFGLKPGIFDQHGFEFFADTTRAVGRIQLYEHSDSVPKTDSDDEASDGFLDSSLLYMIIGGILGLLALVGLVLLIKNCIKAARNREEKEKARELRRMKNQHDFAKDRLTRSESFRKEDDELSPQQGKMKRSMSFDRSIKIDGPLDLDLPPKVTRAGRKRANSHDRPEGPMTPDQSGSKKEGLSSFMDRQPKRRGAKGSSKSVDLNPVLSPPGKRKAFKEAEDIHEAYPAMKPPSSLRSPHQSEKKKDSLSSFMDKQPKRRRAKGSSKSVDMNPVLSPPPGKRKAFKEAEDIDQAYPAMKPPSSLRKQTNERYSPKNTPLQTPKKSILKSPFPTPKISPKLSPKQTPKQTPMQTPMQAPKKSAMKTLMQTPMQTPMKSAMKTPMQTPMKSAMKTPMQTPMKSAMKTPGPSATKPQSQMHLGNKPTATPGPPPLDMFLEKQPRGRRPRGGAKSVDLDAVPIPEGKEKAYKEAEDVSFSSYPAMKPPSVPIES